MAIRFDGGATTQISRTTTLPAIGTFSLLAWAYPVAIGGSAILGAAVSFGAAPITGNFYGLGVGNTNRVAGWNGTAYVSGATVISTNTWIHLALTVAGTGANLDLSYLNGVVELTTTAASISGTNLLVGNSAGQDAFNGRVAAIKVYGAVLTADEIKVEMRSYLPIRVANLLSWHPMLLHTDTAQYSATWTAAGTVTTEQGPPIAWAPRPKMAFDRVPVAATKAPPPRRQAWRVLQRVA